MTDVLVIQNTRLEESGILGELLNADGFKIQSVFAKKEKFPKTDFSVLIILGGPQSANDDHFYLKNEQQLIRDFVTREKPILGICLGSQLIAKAFGANVYPGVKKEIGFYHDLTIDDSGSKLFSGFVNPFTVFHWHEDTFDLPNNAVRLAHSNDYSNQAFQLGTAVGLQFHLEVDENMVNLWLDEIEKKQSKIANIDTTKIRQDINANISTVKKNMDTFYKNFKSTFHL